MKICVYCAANDLPEKYIEPAKHFAKLLAENGHTLVWGGSDVGLMKVMADGVQNGGGKIIGVSLEYYKENARKNADEMIIARTLGDRKAELLSRSDAFVVLVGGLGTLDELTDVLELKKQRHHDKPMIVLNTDGFYDGLKMQIERIFAEGFLSAKDNADANGIPMDRFVSFVDTPEEAIALLGKAPQPDGKMAIPLSPEER